MGKRKKQLVSVLCIAVVLVGVAAAGVSLMNRKSQAERDLYDQYAMEAQKNFAGFNESIGKLAVGELIPKEDFEGQYEAARMALENWNQVFPKFSKKEQLPFVDSMNDRRLEQEDALTVIMEKLENLYSTVSAACYGADHGPVPETEAAEIASLADEVRSNLIVVCKRLSRAE